MEGWLPYRITLLALHSMTEKLRRVILYRDYFALFFNKQKPKAKDKIIWTIRLIEELPRLPRNYFKHIEGTNGLYEIRVSLGNDSFRIFCFFDQEKIIVLGNGFQKKTQKTPKREIEKALKIKLEYENEK